MFSTFDANMSLTFAQEIFKGKIFGPVKEEDDGGEPIENDTRKDSDVEAVFDHHLLKMMTDTLVGSWSASGVIDCTAGQGEFAKTCVEKRIPYLGICLSEAHCVQLKQDPG